MALSRSNSGSTMGRLSFFRWTFRHDWLLNLRKLLLEKTSNKVRFHNFDYPASAPLWVRVSGGLTLSSNPAVLPTPTNDGARDRAPANSTKSNRLSNSGAMPQLPVTQRRYQSVRGFGNSELPLNTPAGPRSAGAVLGGTRSAVPGPVAESRCV